MTKIKNLLLIATFLTVAASSYGQTAKKLITKKWVYKEVNKEYIKKVIAKSIKKKGVAEDSAELQRKIEERIPMMDSIMNVMMKDCYIKFNADGTYEAQIGGELDKGTWELSADNKRLTTTRPSGKKEVGEVFELSTTKLTIGRKDSNGVMRITFIPNK